MTRVAMALAATVAISLVLPAPSAFAAPPTVPVSMPFTGWWDRYGYSYPSYHSTTGNWSTDIYQAAGTGVYPRVVIPSGVRVTLKILSITTTCGSAGRTVKVDVIANGTRVGYFSLAHLAYVPSTIYAGKVITNGTTLVGRLHMWAYQSGCWEVRTSGGIHTHYTACSYLPYHACYRALTSGGYYSATTWIGRVGPTNATGNKQRCRT